MQKSPIDAELGFSPDEGHLATEALGPIIQNVLNKGHNAAAVLIALADVFFLQLGATTDKRRTIDQAAKRFHKRVKRHGYDRRIAKQALEQLGAGVTKLAEHGISDRAICYSLAAAIIRIVRATPGLNADDIKPLTIGLLTQINMSSAS